MSARRLVAILLIIALAAVLRLRAATRLPVDFDEPTYFEAAAALADVLRAGDIARLTEADTAPEHPALAKLAYAAAQLSLPPIDPADPDLAAALPAFVADRSVAVWLGVAHVALLAVVNPLAGALLAVHAYSVKYTAQIYLEALPMLTASVCVLAYRRATAGVGSGRGLWSVVCRPPLLLALSAIALGLTAAGKYIYVAAGVAVALDWAWRVVEARRPRALWPLAGWGGLALLVFVVANPNLWPNPPGRLFDSLAFHAAYAQSAHVQQSGFPWYQPFVWLGAPLPTRWHPSVILLGLEPAIVGLGVVGVVAMMWGWRKAGDGESEKLELPESPTFLFLQAPPYNRVVVLWWAVGLVFTLLWPTKWPQYSLIMTAPMCLCAAEGMGLVRRWLRRGSISYELE